MKPIEVAVVGTGWCGGIRAETLAAHPLVKGLHLAEIREEHLPIHISKYGYFGVGLPSHFLIDRGARPVIYVPLRSDDWRRPGGTTALQDIEQIYRGFLEHVVERLHQARLRVGRDPAMLRLDQIRRRA